jgi:mono/diheme cytochrome c family protein
MGDRLVIVNAVIFSAVFAWAATSTTAVQNEPSRQDMNSGPHLYQEFCASCHGDTGAGDGPLGTTLPRRASDLTMLTQRNGGTFPRAAVLAVVEATRPVPAHAKPAMPNWREVFYRLEYGSERAVRKRIDALVAHIETLQQKN